jgi:plastocyanin
MARIASAVMVVTFALAVSACGGDSGSSSADQVTAAETTTVEGASGTSGASGAASAELEGEVGPGFEIEVKQNGEDAESISAGAYTLKVEDKSDIHNFHLIGPGVDEMVTEVPFKGEKTVTVTLEKGTYTYQCDPHASGGMKGSFDVT